jgi:tRNA (cmo5U34)-methyltransferase
MASNSAQVFTENWTKYKQIIGHNYMHHAELVARSAAVFAGLAPAELHVLDIGCGDGMVILPSLQNVSVSIYTGYDLSPYALELAKENFKQQLFPSTFKEGDMRLLIAEETQQFDVINSGFAIHHLRDDEKRTFLRACFEKLLPGGTMIYIDVFRPVGSGREAYINEYLAYIQNEWIMMTEEEKQPIFAHIQEYDFPSELEETIDWLQQAGFSVAECYQPDHRHAMIVLKK